MRNREISSRFITTAAEPFTGLNRYNLHNREANTTAAGSRGRHYSILRRLSFRTQRKSNLITYHRVVHLLGQMGKQESPLINLFMTLAWSEREKFQVLHRHPFSNAWKNNWFCFFAYISACIRIKWNRIAICKTKIFLNKCSYSAKSV